MVSDRCTVNRKSILLADTDPEALPNVQVLAFSPDMLKTMQFPPPPQCTMTDQQTLEDVFSKFKLLGNATLCPSTDKRQMTIRIEPHVFDKRCLSMAAYRSLARSQLLSNLNLKRLQKPASLEPVEGPARQKEVREPPPKPQKQLSARMGRLGTLEIPETGSFSVAGLKIESSKALKALRTLVVTPSDQPPELFAPLATARPAPEPHHHPPDGLATSRTLASNRSLAQWLMPTNKRVRVSSRLKTKVLTENRKPRVWA